MVRFLLLIGFIGLIQGRGISQANSAAYGSNAKAGKYAEFRGIKMYYEIYGKGEPLLFIHGNGGSIKDFSNQVPYFEKNYMVILADSRAQGKCVDAGDSLSYEMMADDFDALLDALKLDSCFVVGWSDGGINGLLLAMRHPEKVKKLAITGANLWPDTTAVDPFIYAWAMKLNKDLMKTPSSPEMDNTRKLLRLLSYEPNIKTSQLKKITCPVLVMGGDHDVIRPEHTLLIAQSIPKSYVWIAPNAGHGIPISLFEEFNKKVGEFFKQPYRTIAGMDKIH